MNKPILRQIFDGIAELVALMKILDIKLDRIAKQLDLIEPMIVELHKATIWNGPDPGPRDLGDRTPTR